MANQIDYSKAKQQRELCKRCHEWVTEEESAQEIEGCVIDVRFEANEYLLRNISTCPHFNEW